MYHICFIVTIYLGTKLRQPNAINLQNIENMREHHIYKPA